MHISEKLMYSTTRIILNYKDGTMGTGTGFFFNFDFGDDKVMPLLVTNKHVINNADVGTLTFTKRGSIGEKIILTVDDFENQFIKHPDSFVDLAIMPIKDILADNDVFVTMIEENLIPSDENIKNIFVAEDIIMIGYPNSIADEANNFPIFRKGITATSPQFDYENRRTFLVDIACFPGSSGSPVFIYNEGIYTNHNGDAFIGDRLIFLGILFSGFVKTYEGDVSVVEIPTVKRVISQTTTTIHLGIVAKSSCLMDFKNSFYLMKYLENNLGIK